MLRTLQKHHSRVASEVRPKSVTGRCVQVFGGEIWRVVCLAQGHGLIEGKAAARLPGAMKAADQGWRGPRRDGGHIRPDPPAPSDGRPSASGGRRRRPAAGRPRSAWPVSAATPASPARHRQTPRRLSIARCSARLSSKKRGRPRRLAQAQEGVALVVQCGRQLDAIAEAAVQADLLVAGLGRTCVACPASRASSPMEFRIMPSAQPRRPSRPMSSARR